MTTDIFSGCLSRDVSSSEAAPPELTSHLPVLVVADFPEVIRPWADKIFPRIDREERLYSHLD